MPDRPPDDLEIPRRAVNTADVQSQAPGAPRKKHHWKLIAVLVLVVLPVVGFALYTLSVLNFSYSSGERAGFVQKFSKKGWLCKTWEGQMAMATLPGVPPQMFDFTVRDDATAEKITSTLGKRVALHYAQHKGVPTSCFGETEYYVDGVRADSF
jgi:hypothetical protein